jgi:hypothetical protein
MKTLIIVLLALSSITAAFADEWVPGHMKRNGTYVQGYYRTSSDGYSFNNYSNQGNYNPYTGQTGHHKPKAKTGYENLYLQPVTVPDAMTLPDPYSQ